MPSDLYQIIPLEANLRSNTRIEPRSVITRLRQGQVVEHVAIKPAPPKGWMRVRTELQGTPVEGFIKVFLLQKVQQVPVVSPPPVLPNIPEAHLPAAGSILLTQHGDGPRAYALTEKNAPSRSGSTPLQQAAQLGEIVDFLRVDQSPRYATGSGKTYCNIYMHDYCRLSGAYLPRVWWTRKALVSLAASGKVQPAYGTTVQELNANSLYQWLEEFGPDFGWRRTVNVTKLQEAANSGQVCLIVGQRKELNQPGHICAVVPETKDHIASRKAGLVSIPLQSQAGSRNFRYGGRVWWTASQFGRFAFWIHA